MTDSDDPHAHTRPISVAELLARNGTIGAPPVGGRRRRRRGNSDAVTVAELTGEIPVIRVDPQTTVREPVEAAPEPPAPEPEPPVHEPPVEEAVEEPATEEVEPEPTSEAEATPEAEPAPEDIPEAISEAEAEDIPEAEAEAEAEPVLTEAEADYAAHLEQRDVDPDPLVFTPPPRRARVGTPTSFAAQAGGAEQMSPDPVVDDDELLDLGPDVDFDEVLDKHAPEATEVSGATEAAEETEEVPSYLRSSSDTLFGGQSVADDLARRGPRPGPEDIDLGDHQPEASTPPTEPAEQSGSALLRGVWVVAQCILAVAFGAGLFIAFDQLWRWNTIVALVLSVLVILGLVVGVRVVRKTEDIGSTLIAVAVGALVTLGPLALLQSH